MMDNHPIRQALLTLPQKRVPAPVSTRLRVIASHERDRRVRRTGWSSISTTC